MPVFGTYHLGRLLLALCLAASCLNAQISLTEVMFDPLGSERTDEFVELYNSGPMAVDLSGWRLGDGSGFDVLRSVENLGMVLQTGQYALVLDPDYLSDGSDTYTGLIPPDALLLTIESSTFGANGLSNSVSETVTLVSADLDTVFRYLYTLDNPPGYSDEKIDPIGGDAPANWANARNVNGTPGGPNSRTPAAIDLTLAGLQVSAGALQVGLDVGFTAWIKNIGIEPVGDYALIRFLDVNGNDRADPSEIMDDRRLATVLYAGDSLHIAGAFTGLSYGEQRLGLWVRVAGESDTTDNILLRDIFVDDPGRVGVRINEIMFQPRSGEAEWLELYNAGNTVIDLHNLYVADARDTVFLTDTERLLLPGAFAVLGGDSAMLWQYALSPDAVLINRHFPSLNNDVDQLLLLGPSFAVYDRVPYTSEWFGREVNKGVSLEKLNPLFDGHLAESWAAAVAPTGSTPGRDNSVRLQLATPGGRLDIAPNPFSPDQDGHEDVAVIRYQLPYPTAFANVRMYDLRGRLVRQLAADVPIASRGQFIWDGRDETRRVSPIGAYICLFQVRQPDLQRAETFKKTVILVKR